eukprot:1367060-Amphidinium_carterae.2
MTFDKATKVPPSAPHQDKCFLFFQTLDLLVVMERLSATGTFFSARPTLSLPARFLAVAEANL